MKKVNAHNQRPTRFENYLNRAKVASERSTCLRRRVGAIIVKGEIELSSGYVGSPRGGTHCIDIGKCLRRELGIQPGTRYELCRSVHAEQNAIINAARTGMSIVDGEMYIYSKRLEGEYEQANIRSKKIYGPCIICKKEIINAGLTKVHMWEDGVGKKTYTIKNIRNLLDKEEKERWQNDKLETKNK